LAPVFRLAVASRLAVVWRLIAAVTVVPGAALTSAMAALSGPRTTG